MAYHLRSISLPSRPHSSEAEVQQELDILEAIISSPSTCIVTMCDGLRRLGDIYSGVEEMIHLPSNQVCSSHQRKMLDGEIESSLELLDLCNTVQEIFVELKAVIQEFQMALRKGDDATVQARIHSYSRLVKKAKQCFKKASKKAASDKTDCAMIRLLTKAREITVSLLESTLQLLSKQIEMPKKSRLKGILQEESSCLRGGPIAGVRVQHWRSREWSRTSVQDIGPEQSFSSKHPYLIDTPCCS